MIWDFQNAPLDAGTAREVWFYMNKYLDIAFPNIENWKLRVYASYPDPFTLNYSSSGHSEAVKNLSGFDVVRVYGDADRQIKEDIRNLCGVPVTHQSPYFPGLPPVISRNVNVNPQDTVLVFVSKDGDFADLIYDVDDAGVDVYLWAPPGCSNALIDAVRSDHIIPWGHPRRIVSQDNLRRHRR